MSERGGKPGKPLRRRRLSLAQPIELPTSLVELAGDSSIGAGLRRRLGEESLWLFAEPLYAYMLAGDDIPDLLEDTARIPVPVRYLDLRRTFTYEEDEVIPGQQLGVFTVLGSELRRIEQYYEHVVYDYPEVAISLGQAATLLELYEFNPAQEYGYRKRPSLLPGRRL